MTLDDAIRHCEKTAKRLLAENLCSQCAAEHAQLADWLKELKERRELNLSEFPTGSI